MANKRIQDLEQTTDLTNDDLLPLDTTKKTFATTLKSLSEWLKNTFQTKDNLEQALSEAIDKYPSSKVLKDESSRIKSVINSVQTVLSSSISDETTNRINADTNLQNQINGKISWWASGNCVRFVNLQICWGITNSENVSTIYLPQAFKNTSYVVVGLPMQGSTNTSDLYVHSKTTTQFKLQEYVQKAEQRNWLAIGYWH